MKLPDECLGLIFSRLNAPDRNRCSLVCKRWLGVEAQGRRLLSLLAQSDLAPLLPSLLCRFENVTRLALKCPRRTPGIDDNALVLVGGLCPQLRRLKLKGCRQLSDDGLVDFAKICGPLKKFSCGSCAFGVRGLNGILRHCAFLEDVSLKRLRGLVDDPKEFVGPGTNKIKRICLKELCNAHLLSPLIAGSKHLKTLILCRVFGNWDRLLEIITEHLKELVELHLEKLQVSDRGLLAVAQCRSLQVLYLIKAPECGNWGLTVLAMGCKRLRKLHIDGCLSGRIGDEGLISLAEKCSELQELVLMGVNTTSESLVVVGANCSQLERLALCNSETFGDNELACVAHKCNALRNLCIKGCPISDKGLEALTGCCPNLSKVKIKKCKGVSATGATTLQMSRGGLLVSLDTEILVTPKEIPPIRTSQEGSGMQSMHAATPSSRSALAKAKLALAAGGSFVAGTLLRRTSSSSGS
ncbi:hypothetical protein O6H91_06G098400 [Diphasiastrum complanatum]|nr:hypothetical protein O6H91_06G098400 [Diphasiastrum complanatum]